MRLIDADSLVRKIKGDIAYKDYEWSMYADDFIENMIMDAPTIDAVEVVRCKDCKYFTEYRHNLKLNVCINAECFTEPNDYCSYGERKGTC